MRFKITLAIAGIAALAISSGTATAGNGDKVTGGGQILVGDNAGSTIAFTAQGTTDTAKGQVQVIDRTGGKGQDQVNHHGVVECVEVMGNFGVVGGTTKAGEPFTLRVLDGGKPNDKDGDGVLDAVEFETNSEFECGDDESDDEPGIDLARGNVKVRDGDLSNPEPEENSSTSTSMFTLLGL